MSSLVAAKYGVLRVADVATGLPRLQVAWNIYPDVIDDLGRRFSSDNPLSLFVEYPPDQPYNVTTAIGTERYLESRLFREFSAPRGCLDSLGVTVLSGSERHGALSFARSVDVGWSDNDDLAVLRAASPHVRRALLIGDLLQRQGAAIRTFELTIYTLVVPVILRGPGGWIVHANDAARSWLEQETVIASRHGMLRVTSRSAAAEMQAAFSQTAQADDTMEPVGIDIALPGEAGQVHRAHVLPIGKGAVRGDLGGQATAAIFLSGGSACLATAVRTAASVFGLTAAEARVLNLLVDGRTVAEITDVLEIAASTVRSHVARRLQKTCTSRQADMIDRVRNLGLPLREAQRGRCRPRRGVRCFNLLRTWEPARKISASSILRMKSE